MAGDNPIDEGIVQIKMLFTTGEQPGRGIDPVIDKTRRAEREINALERGVDHLRTKLSGSWLGKTNDLIQTIGGLGMGALGLGAIAAGLGSISDKAVQAAVHAEEMRDKLEASVWLLKSQGLVSGVDDFAGAMAVARREMTEFYAMAREGVGDPGKYADAYARLSRPLLKAGGSLSDLKELTRDLVPMTTLYGDAAVDAAARLLLGFKRIQPDMLNLFNLTKEQVAAWKTGEEALEAIRASMAGMRPIAEAQAEDIAAKMQKAHDETALAWKQAGEAWAPVINGAMLWAAKRLTDAGDAWDVAFGGKEQRIADEWKASHPGWQDEYNAFTLPTIDVMEQQLAVQRDMAGSMTATGRKVDQWGKDLEESGDAAATGLAQVADAAEKASKDFLAFVERFSIKGNFYNGNFVGEEETEARRLHSLPVEVDWESRTGLPIDMINNRNLKRAAAAREAALAEGMGSPELEAAWQRTVKSVLMHETAPGKANTKAVAALDAIAKSFEAAVAGRANITIGQVNQYIDTRNHEPGRIGRLVRDELVKAAQYPTGPRTTPAFSTHG